MISLEVAVIIIVIVVLISCATWFINYKYFTCSVKGRQKVIEFGHLLISQATSDVVMFGKDLSWAKDYYNLVKELVKDNKEVKVYYVKSDVTKAMENAKTLEDAGAKVIPLKEDFGLRGTLIDPLETSGVRFYSAYRVKNSNAKSVYGNKGNDNDYNYRGVAYNNDKGHCALIQVYVKIYNNIEYLVSD